MTRDSFIFYRSIYEAIRFLPSKDKLAAYEAICDYAINGNTPQLSGNLGAIFTIIKPQIDVNNKRFENGKKGATYGQKGGRPKIKTPTEPQSNPKLTATKPQTNPKLTATKPQTNPKLTPNVNDDVNVNDNVNVYSSDEDYRADVVKILPKIAIDCVPLYTLEQYKQAADALGCSVWASANLTHLSKIHNCLHKLLSGFYADRLKTSPNASEIITTDFDSEKFNAIFDKTNNDLI